jgi:adenylylsulfate kinase-like enzyme
MGKLIFFAGHAGTGKTTLAKRAMPILMEKMQASVHFFGQRLCLWCL